MLDKGKTDLIQKGGARGRRKMFSHSKQARAIASVVGEGKARQVRISTQHGKAHGRIHANLEGRGPEVATMKMLGRCPDGADGEIRSCFAIWREQGRRGGESSGEGSSG